jgi:ribonucleoside-diphosphate reductase alpha chain
VIQKAGGGTGFDFGALRPTGDRIAFSGGTTSGPVSFMRVFAEATKAIQQGAFRRGANMAMMSVEHPDILKFITAKCQPGDFENFNFSVKVTNTFMDRLRHQSATPHLTVNPRDGRKYLLPKDVEVSAYGLQDLIPAGSPKRPCYTVADVWDLITHSAHARGEPGLCFIDRVNLDNPTPAQGRIEATNPCGEQPLLPFESCNLGSINLARFVSASRAEIDWNRLGWAIVWGIRFLDDAVDASSYPISQIQQVTLGNRKIGLGVMGFADALVLLGIRYDSQEAVAFAEEVARFLRQHARQASESLAATRGCFPKWAGSIWDMESGRPMRNATCTTIAPTGSISILARCSSGIEPIYGLVTRRRAMDEEFVEVHPLIEWLGRQEGWLTARVMAALLEGMPADQIQGFPKRLANLLVTAHEVAPEWHVRVQSAFQQHVDNAVSKTVNLPAKATVADVNKTFRLAYELGCKGITVYRENCREQQTLTAAGSSRRSSGGMDKGPAPEECPCELGADGEHLLQYKKSKGVTLT